MKTITQAAVTIDDLPGLPSAHTKRHNPCEAYLKKAEDSWAEVTVKYPLQRRYFQWGTRCVCVEFVGGALFSQLAKAIEHREVPFHSSPDLTIYVWDRQSTGIGAIPNNAPHEPFVGTYFPEEPSRNDFEMALCYRDQTFSVLHRKKKRAYFWSETATFLPVWELSSPFRPILHWWWRPLGLQIVHGAVVGKNGKGVLIVGKGGSGKSTIAFACLRSGMDFLGEDYCLIDVHRPLTALSLYSTGKLTWGGLQQFPLLRSMVNDLPPITLYPHDKNLYYLGEKFRPQIKDRLLIQTILIPELHTQTFSSLEPTSRANAVRALAPSTLVQLPLSNDSDLRQMVSMTETLPAYRMKLGSDLSGVVDRIDRILENLDAAIDPAVVSTHEGSLERLRPDLR